MKKKVLCYGKQLDPIHLQGFVKGKDVLSLTSVSPEDNLGLPLASTCDIRAPTAFQPKAFKTSFIATTTSHVPLKGTGKDRCAGKQDFVCVCRRPRLDRSTHPFDRQNIRLRLLSLW